MGFLETRVNKNYDIEEFIQAIEKKAQNILILSNDEKETNLVKEKFQKKSE